MDEMELVREIGALRADAAVLQKEMRTAFRRIDEQQRLVEGVHALYQPLLLVDPPEGRAHLLLQHGRVRPQRADLPYQLHFVHPLLPLMLPFGGTTFPAPPSAGVIITIDVVGAARQRPIYQPHLPIGADVVIGRHSPA